MGSWCVGGGFWTPLIGKPQRLSRLLIAAHVSKIGQPQDLGQPFQSRRIRKCQDPSRIGRFPRPSWYSLQGSEHHRWRSKKRRDSMVGRLVASSIFKERNRWRGSGVCAQPNVALQAVALSAHLRTAASRLVVALR